MDHLWTLSWTLLFGVVAIILPPPPSWTSRYVPAQTAFPLGDIILAFTAPPLVPAPPPPAAARMSCPWRDTSRWQWTTPRGPAPAGQSWHTACPDRGSSGPRGGACRVRRRGRGPGCSELRLARPPGGPDGRRSPRGAAGTTPRAP